MEMPAREIFRCQSRIFWRGKAFVGIECRRYVSRIIQSADREYNLFAPLFWPGIYFKLNIGRVQVYLFFLASIAWMLNIGAVAFLGAGLGFFAFGGATARCLVRLRADFLLPPPVSLGIGVEVSQSSESDDEEES